MTQWRWKVNEKWVCRHCPAPDEKWDEVIPVTFGGTWVRQVRTAVLFNTVGDLAEHYRTVHWNHPEIANYLFGLWRKET